MKFTLLLTLAFVAIPSAHAQTTFTPKPGSTTTQTLNAPVMATKPASPPDTELLRNSTTAILQRDYDTELLRVPENIRGGFGTDTGRINSLLQQILVNKTLSTQARAEGLDKDPQMQQRMQLEFDKMLATEVMKRDTERIRREFDALPNMDQAAREQYLTQPDKFREPAQYKVSYILFRVPPHSTEEAKELAQAAREKVVAGADMNALARAESEDPKAKSNSGILDWATLNNWDPTFGRAVERLQKEGDVSPPVKTPYGYQVIRLDGKQLGKQVPFDNVKAGIIDQLRTTYVDGKMADRLNAIRKDPQIVVNQPAVDALVVRIDPEYVKRITQEAGAKANAKKRSDRAEAERARIERAGGTPAADDADEDDAPAAPAPAARPAGK